MKLDQNINPLVKIIIALIILICLTFAHSIYLIVILTILTIIFALIEIKIVKEFLISLKNCFLLLSIFSILIIIILGINANIAFLMLYKMLISSMVIAILNSSMDFYELHSAIYNMIYHVKFLDCNKISLKASLFMFFIKSFISSRKDIVSIQRFNNRIRFTIKYYFFPRLLLSIKKVDNLKLSLKLDFYEVQYKKMDFKSKALLTISLLFFIICIFKEVIL